MLKRYRRLIAVVLAPITFFFMSGGELLRAAEQAQRAAEQVQRAAAAQKTVRQSANITADLFDRRGKVRLHVEGGSFRPLALSMTIRKLRSDSSFLQKWRASAQQYGKKSKRGKASVATVLQVIDALAAPTEAEYHDRVRSLDVDVVTSAARDEFERDGIETSFVVRGVVKLRVFKAAVDDPADTVDPILKGEDSEPTLASGPFVAEDEPGTRAVQECYVDGEICATEQEREDAIIVAVAMDDEAQAVEADMNAEMLEIEEYCSQYPSHCNEFPGDVEAFTSGPSADGEPSSGPCSNEFWGFVGATLSTYGVGLGLIGLLLSPIAIPAIAVVGGIFAVAGGLAWMYSDGSSLLDCKRRLLLL